ncbi:MAG: UDP-N-acetylmuramoyl-L-alanyl-D-glutamate--2,6-diaminopimelate ligase [Phycisphaerae bacterium]|nr:UDP-N-acetylmuramoyl-L-alanyl-D-glutamate--2,6-diaminopimelate ligase [Phycisphaerae bacterium]
MLLETMTPRTETRTLGTLLEGIVGAAQLAGRAAQIATGVYDDSRRVTPGGIFVALRGTRADGGDFVRDALARGAAVVLGERFAQQDERCICVSDARAALATLAARWYGLEQRVGRTLRVAGVTGTNGKSTTAFMTTAIVRAAGQRCGMLGTVYYDLCGRVVAANMTTPGPLELAAYVRECADAGAAAAVMEVSSHALDQRRTDGLSFSAAAFTNLTGDHLDYHQTLAAYRDAKERLFAGLGASAVAVVNRDDEHQAYMVRRCAARVMTYSLLREADITARVTRETIKGTHYVLRIAGRDLALENAVVGRHNVYNAAAAAGLALALGYSTEAIAAGLSSLRNIPGRLQRVPSKSGFDVFVDYAHTDDALANVLHVLRKVTPRKLLVLFGCGGDRDRTKRPRMGRVAVELADEVIVTSDNPRSEPPSAIIEEILSGIDPSKRSCVAVEADRRRAIQLAIDRAAPGDVVLIAGKGHENYQILGSQRVPFDDVEVAIDALAGRRAGDASAG